MSRSNARRGPGHEKHSHKQFSPVMPGKKAVSPQTLLYTGVTPENLDGHMCRWPLGDPHKPGFMFCGRDAQKGRPYCAVHLALAYLSAKELAAQKSGNGEGQY